MLELLYCKCSVFFIEVTVLVLSCLLAASSSAPQAQKLREDRSTTQLEVDDIGVYFKWVVEAANPEASTLSMEVSNSNVTLAQCNNIITSLLLLSLILQLKDTTFNSLVCPLFGIYSRFYTALQSLPEEDPRHHDVSVLVFVTERHAKSLCEDVSSQLSDTQN